MRRQAKLTRLTSIELVVLGLVAEQPRHGYDVEAAIAARRLRSWTPIGFSSIYHVLNKLGAAGLLSDRERGRGVKQRVYRTTREGRRLLGSELIRLITTPLRTGHEVELAMMFADSLGREEFLAALAERARRAAANLREEQRLQTYYRQAHGRLWTDIIFQHTVAHMAAELAWSRSVLAELKRTKVQSEED